MSRRPARYQAEAGQTTLLIIGFAVVAAMLVGVVVDASAAYLRRSGLDSLADGAALSAADAVQARQVYEGGLGARAEIDPAQARAYVAQYLNASGAARRYPGLGYTVQTDRRRIVVRVVAPLHLPITPPGSPATASVSGTAAAVVVVSR